MSKPYYIVSFSGGKDSTAMLLKLLETGRPVDEIVFFDTTVEFPQMYQHIDAVERYIGMPITRLKAEHDFEYMLLRHKMESRSGEIYIGHSFASARIRWCTGYFKENVMKRYIKEDLKAKEVINYIGIAKDESRRAKLTKSKEYPLIGWNMTEAEALEFCYNRGFDWGGLYKLFKRVSCWCCPLQSLNSCRQLRHHFPELWQKLRVWDKQVWRHFRADYTVEDLEQRFSTEDELEALQVNLWERDTTDGDFIKKAVQKNFERPA